MGASSWAGTQGTLSMPGIEGTIAWQAHIGGFLAVTHCLLRRAAELRGAVSEGGAPPVADVAPPRLAA